MGERATGRNTERESQDNAIAFMRNVIPLRPRPLAVQSTPLPVPTTRAKPLPAVVSDTTQLDEPDDETVRREALPAFASRHGEPAPTETGPTVQIVELGSEHLVSLPDDTEVRINRMITEELKAPKPPPEATAQTPMNTDPGRTRRNRTVTVAALAFAVVWNVAIGAYLACEGLAKHETHTAAVRTPPAAPPIAHACAVTTSPHVLARGVLVRGGVEASASENRIGLGVVKGNREGVALELDASSMAVKTATKVIASESLRRVIPAIYADEPLDATGEIGPMYVVDGSDGEPHAVGVTNGYLEWRAHDATEGARLWPMTSDVEAPRVARAGDERVVVFRQGGGIWMGAMLIDRDGVHPGALARVSESALQVGAPAIDARGDLAVVAWAQRESRSRWSVRWVRARHGARTGAVQTLSTPSETAIAPSVAVLADGRFLLSWTEGARTGHRVRAQLFDASDAPLGEALDISAPGFDAGQAQLAVGGDGRGTAGYLVARGRSFDLVASSVSCR